MDLNFKLAYVSLTRADENVQISYLVSARECGSNVLEGRTPGVRRDMGETIRCIALYSIVQYTTLST